MTLASDDDVLWALRAIGPVGPRQLYDDGVLGAEAQGAGWSGALWPDEVELDQPVHGVRAVERAGRRAEDVNPPTGMFPRAFEHGREPLATIDPIVSPGLFDSGTRPFTNDCGVLPSGVGSPDIGESRTYDDVNWVPDGDAYELVLPDEPHPGWTWSDCERDLIERVWALLIENLDLADYAMRVADGRMDPDTEVGPRGDYECVRERILGLRSRPIAIYWQSDCIGKMWTERDERHIGFCTDSDANPRIAADIFCQETEHWNRDRMCALVTTAASLFHEITHTCDYSHRTDEDEIPLPCSFPYIAGNYFAAGLFERYPQAKDSACCSEWTARYDASGVRDPLDFWDGVDASQFGGSSASRPLPLLLDDCMTVQETARPGLHPRDVGLNPGPNYLPPDHHHPAPDQDPPPDWRPPFEIPIDPPVRW